jgi:hypothetical protein
MIMEKKLGTNALETLGKIVVLMDATNDPQELDRLEALRVKLTKQIATLVEITVDAASKEYQDAQNGLTAASQAIDKAIAGLETIAKVINTVAQGVELVSKLAAA